MRRLFGEFHAGRDKVDGYIATADGKVRVPNLSVVDFYDVPLSKLLDAYIDLRARARRRNSTVDERWAFERVAETLDAITMRVVE